MVAGRPKLGTLLVQQQILTPEQLDDAIRYQAATGCRLGQALIEIGFCSDAVVARALAEQLGIPFVDLDQTPPDPECVALVPPEMAIENQIIPVRKEGARLVVAVLDPYNIRLDEALRLTTGMHVMIAMAPEAQLSRLLGEYYSYGNLHEPLLAAADGVEPDAVEPEEADYPAIDQLIAAGEQVSIIRVVNRLIAEAALRGASDLHIDPEPDRIRVRCRIDGRMCAVASLPTDLLPSIVARIKIMAGLDIAESRKPQDGGCSLKVNGRVLEMRVSTLRTINGESAVLRILNSHAELHSLEQLGMEDAMHQHLRQLLSARHGMILVTGPTGSGKTTSVYAALNHLNHEELNILTVEDPVEARLSGIKQVQVHERAGRSFASTLRSILRQDPDVIMIGEIRDAETGDIACRAALTGHLVLSTMHTQDSLSAVTRLLEMGLEPWIVAACLNGVMAQRLVRRVCPDCAADHVPPPGLHRALASQYGCLDAARFQKGIGCDACCRTGTKGRAGVYELLTMDDTMRDILSRGANVEQLRKHLTAQGFQNLEADAFLKSGLGLIPPEEIIHLGFRIAMSVEAQPTAHPSVCVAGDQ